MKILIINTVPTGKNGITNVIFNYLSAMEREQDVIDYVSLNNPSEVYRKDIEKQGGKLYVLPRSSKSICKYWNGLRKLIKKNQYDVVHIHGNSHTVTLELSAAKAAGCAVRIVHAHNTMCKHKLLHTMLTPLFNVLYTHGLACGIAAGRFMFEERLFTVMNNGIDTDKFAFDVHVRDSIRAMLNWEKNLIIGHVGAFTEVKNQSFIIEVFSVLYNLNPNYKLILIGDGPLKTVVEQKITMLGLEEAVCLTGNIDNVNEYLNAIDVIIMPSLFEGLPLTLVEQQANGLRCFVSDVITKEADKTDNLTFIPLSDTADFWAQTIINDNDDCTRDKRSRCAIQNIRNKGYDIKLQAKKLENLYKSAIRS